MTYLFLFFPFTHMPGKQLDTILAFFPSFGYLSTNKDFKQDQRLENLVEKGKIVPFFSSTDELGAVEQKVEQYLEWARIHKGNEVNLRLLLKQAPYFTDESDVTAIKTQIKGSKNVLLPDEAIAQKDLLFLKLAQLCDEQNERIDRKLNDLNTSHDKLMSALRGIESPLSDSQGSTAEQGKDSGAMMTRERICAWSRCVSAKKGLEQGQKQVVFFTTSEAVFDYLESNCKDVINALDIDKIKVHENGCENIDEWQYQFCDYLVQAIQGNSDRGNDLPEVNDACLLSGRIKLSLFSGDEINQLFNCQDKQVPVCLIKLN